MDRWSGPAPDDRQRTTGKGALALKPRLILHIGAHRTATSALQDFLHANVEPLQEKGFLYPFQVRRHVKLMNDFFAGRRQVSEIGKKLSTRMINRKKALHTMILSDEDICMRRDLSVLAEFREWFDVKVVFTLRRQDTWLESWYFQNIKWQWNPKLSHCTFPQFMDMRDDFHWIHYDAYVRHLESLFGAENLILNVMEKEQMPQGPIETFCDSIGLTDREGLTPPAHINESFSPLISEFMRCMPLDQAPPSYRNVLTGAFASVDRKLSGGRKTQSERLLTHRQRSKLLAEYEAGNHALAQRYFNRDKLFLAPLPGPREPLADMNLPKDSETLLKDYMAPLLSALIAQHRTQSSRKDEDE